MTRLSIPKLLSSVFLENGGRVRVRFWNAGAVSIFISHSHRTLVVDVFSVIKPVFRLALDEGTVKDRDDVHDEGLGGGQTRSVGQAAVVHERPRSKEEWRQLFPALFGDDVIFGSANELEVCCREVSWKTNIDDIPLCNRGVTYEAGEVSPSEIETHLAHLEKGGVIRELDQGEKAYFSPAMFLRKRQGSVRKVVDLRMVNSYAESWNMPMTGARSEECVKSHSIGDFTRRSIYNQDSAIYQFVTNYSLFSPFNIVGSLTLTERFHRAGTFHLVFLIIGFVPFVFLWVPCHTWMTLLLGEPL